MKPTIGPLTDEGTAQFVINEYKEAKGQSRKPPGKAENETKYTNKHLQDSNTFTVKLRV